MPAPDPYTTAAAVRAWWSPLFDDETKYPDAMVSRLVGIFEQGCERARGVAWRRREATLRKTATQYGWTTVSRAVDPTVVSASVNGTALSDDAVAALYPITDDLVLGNGPWCPGDRLELVVEHGFTEPNDTCTEALMEFLRFKLLAVVNAQPRNTISYTDDSGYTFRESTASWADRRYTGIRAVDDLLNMLPDYTAGGIG